MIQLLATRYRKHIAYALASVFCLGLVIPVYGAVRETVKTVDAYAKWKYYSPTKSSSTSTPVSNNTGMPVNNNPYTSSKLPVITEPSKSAVTLITDKKDIDGPSQPEMNSFKPAGTNDMVNLFSGDFSYNIPLLDVGGYPVNIFYDGGIGVEQEASWVGLGWNINPGNINRNMRGVPDDFNGEEKLIQEQNMKKNVTWGLSLGADLELFGLKEVFNGSVGVSLGFSVNNYLGPSMELGLKGSTGFSVGGKTASEKGPIGVSMGLNASLSSRNGLTFTPNVSLSASTAIKDAKLTAGVGLSTSYNSRSGIKSLQLSGQMSANYELSKLTNKLDSKGMPIWLENDGSMGGNILSSSISFTKPSYIPSMRSVVTNLSRAGRFQIGGAMFGMYPSFEIEGYGQVSSIEPADRLMEKAMVGYLYAEKARGNRDAVMDFTRFNDKEVTPTTSIVSVPQYAYDVFSIQSEGTGGTIRAYRNDNGYVRDNFNASKDKSWSLGVDIGIPGHVGGNFNIIKSPSTVGEWNAGNKLRNTIGFGNASGDRENVYFRNPGENSVLNPSQYDSIGGTDLVRYKLGGTGFVPTIETKLQRLTPSGIVLGEFEVQKSLGPIEREKRTQVVSFLNGEEASVIGLDKKIKVYNPDPLNYLDVNKKLHVTQEIERNAGDRKKHHISQINVTEADGKRYIYGLPVYNLSQKDLSFTVNNDCYTCDEVPYSADDASLTSSHIQSGVGGKDGYTQITTTPPYAHSFLLSGLLSPDYVDVNGDGITEDDLGGAVKFNYTLAGAHRWRTPLKDGMFANSNPGNLSENRDDKGIVSLGTRESWYLHSIESKTMIAFFQLEDRLDGNGLNEQFTAINYQDNSLKRLRQIDLYNKADLKKNGLAGAKPVKTVHFGYNYTLCPETRDAQSGGKLTLERIWFTYNGKNRAIKNQYVFEYSSGAENPVYAFNASDRWGNYKPVGDNPESLMNRDYPYAVQIKAKADQNANAWALKKVLLPSGGQLEVEYESDDYAFVQNKRAAVMSGIIGFSNSESNPVSNLYNVNGGSITENDYMFIKVPVACATREEVYQTYLQNVTQIAVKLVVNVPKGYEVLTSYATINDYGIYSGAGGPGIWIKMNKVDGYSPLSQTAIEFLRQQLPGQAFPGYDVSDSDGIEAVFDMLAGWWDAIKSSFASMPQYLRGRGLAQSVQVNKSFVRLNDPDGFKYGGGHRVKKITLKDNWKKMTHPTDPNQGYTSVYGQEYDYTTKEIFRGVERTISSGVASYEPSVGGEENPFQTIVHIANTVPLGPTSYGAIEMPVLDAFFPAPMVGYSKVTVTSLGKKQNPEPTVKKTRSGVGRQVTEFYTAKDFPVYYNHTPLDPVSDKKVNMNPTLSFFYKYAFDSRAISQGFIVATNDMHGKMKSQSSYAENDPASRINYTENFYRNTGAKGLDEKFDFVHSAESGAIRAGNMGIDIELMTDTREFQHKTNGFEVQAQVDWMFPFPPVWVPFVWPVVTESENTYRAVTTTKVINYHAVLDSVVVIDKGSQVSNKNIVYDAETGQVVVNRTNNEFDKPIYSVSFPAYWAYSGMSLAYKNIDAVYSGVNFLDGRINMTMEETKARFESGDELYVYSTGSATGCDPAMVSSGEKQIIWALDLDKNTGSLTNTSPDFIFIDKFGKPYTRSGVSFRIVRSGKRNVLGAPVAAVTLMTNPVATIAPNSYKLIVNGSSNVVNASAVEYKEKWQTDNDVFKKYKIVQNLSTPVELTVNGNFTAGVTGFSTDYIYDDFNPTPGNYRVSPTSSGWFGTAPPCTNHTPGGGNMMQVDGANSFNRVWYQTVSVTPNTSYTLSAYICSINETNTPWPVGRVQFTFNGTGVAPVFNADAGQCVWKNISVNWYSGSNTSVTIGILNIDWSGAGNDYAIDDISFMPAAQCSFTEVEDCDGYLEKKINPYVKGLLGNFKGHRNMVFYGERTETNPTSATNLPQNGFLAGFGLYWNFDANNNLVPDLNNLKWVWNTEATRFNSKGMELETKDALGIYTAAQYGYAKTLPVAIANNSRSGHMFYEGFEDYNYNDLLNNSAYNTCTERYVNFGGFDFSEIIDASTAGISAHTGKQVLKIDPGQTIIKTIGVQSPVTDFQLQTIPTNSTALFELGGVYSCQAYQNGNGSCGVGFGNLSMDISNGGTTMADAFNYGSESNTTQYTIIPSYGTYNFYMHIRIQTNSGMTGLGTLALKIEDLNGVVVGEKVLYCVMTVWGIEHANDILQANLCPGVYKITTNFTTDLVLEAPIGFQFQFFTEADYHCTTPGLTSYRSLNSQSSCTFTKPIEASASMINPGFAIPPYTINSNNKMVFSAWVREADVNVSNYTGNEVKVDLGNGITTLKPSGPVIEGWQRYEGYFSVPAGASTMQLSLVNLNLSGPLYFDDIRIHPFNANMKSYVYDPVNLRLRAELDANNYASFYEYDEEGTLVRTKVETREGVKTVTESRSAKQKDISTFQ